MGLGRGFESHALRLKRPLEEEEEEAEVEGEPKRACTDGANSEMEEFFALMERIAATEKLHGGKKGANEQKRMGACGSVWRPAFVWEDFCSEGNGNRTRDVESKPDEEDRREEEILHDNKNDDKNKNTYDFLNQGRSADTSNNEDCDVQRLDLNLPTSGLQHFF